MESGSAVSNVSGASDLRVAAETAAPAQPVAQSSEPVSAPAPESESPPPPPPPSSDDAVRVELSQARRASENEEPRQSEEAESDPKPQPRERERSEANQVSREDAEKIARRFEKAINQTQVRFQVSFEERGNNVLNFQVIDKETGKIVRQFPPDQIIALDQQLSRPGSSGKIFTESA